MLVVDQFEEVFTVCRDAGERASFIAELAEAAADRGEPARLVVLAIRADFYRRWQRTPGSSSRPAANHVLVGPMQPRRVAPGDRRLPAERAGLRTSSPSS